tara:strand:+ start:202 stop:960 length:759 start_codon:yes stop_codon:yes gene_type:complete
MWAPKTIQNTGFYAYNELISGEIPALIVPNVISVTQCELLCKKILQSKIVSSGLGISKKIGTSLSSHIYEKSKYFANSTISNQTLQNLFSKDSPINTMQKKISSIFEKQISVATENDMLYSNAVIRIHQDGDSVHLHRDNSNFEMSEYEVSHFKNQLSAILYLQSPSNSGNLTIYKKFWNKNDERMRVPNFGYSSNLVQGLHHTSIIPITGNMVILNPKFYHQIEPVFGNKSRITLGFFFGEFSQNSLRTWA